MAPSPAVAQLLFGGAITCIVGLVAVSWAVRADPELYKRMTRRDRGLWYAAMITAIFLLFIGGFNL